MSDSTPPIKKVVLLGPASVGKTSLLSQFIEGYLPNASQMATNLRVNQVVVETDVGRLLLNIWDIGGGDSLHSLPPYYLEGCDGYLYVIDLSRSETWRGVRRRLQHLERRLPHRPFLLIANKADAVSRDRLASLLRRMRVSPDMCVSAKTQQGVQEVFQRLGQAIIQSPPPDSRQ